MKKIFTSSIRGAFPMRKIIGILIILLLISSPAYGANRYVNPACASGCDGTTWNKGWAAFSDIIWNDLVSEDSTLYLSGGASGQTYADLMAVVHATTSYRLTIRPGSADANPTGHDGLVTLTGGIKLGDDLGHFGNNVTIDGETTVGAGTRNMTLDLEGKSQHGIWVRYAGTVGLYIRYMELTGMLTDWTSGTTYMVKGATRVEYCYFHDNVGHTDIYTASAVDGTAYGQGLIHHNIIEAGTVNYISGGAGYDIYNNSFDATNASEPYDIIHYYGGGNGIHYLRVWNNYFKSIDQMIFLENSGGTGCTAATPCKTEKIRIFNNVFDTPTAGVGKPIMLENDDSGENNSRPVDDVLIANNTFVNTQYGIRYYGPHCTQAYSNVTVKNNIGYNTVLMSDGRSTTWADDSTVLFDYNLIYKSGGYSFIWQNATHNAFKSYTSISDFATDHATFTHNVAAGTNGSDPLFKSSSDFNLQLGSPAVNVGADLTSITNMPSGWPFDKNGISRPQGAAWDIGAYELQVPASPIGTGFIVQGVKWQ